MFNKKFQSIAIVFAMVVVLAVAGMSLVPARETEAFGGGNPGTGSMVNWQTVTFANSDEISATQYYSPSGYTTLGYLAQGWYKMDVFVTVDISGTNTITVTPQFSIDGSNWVDAQYEAEGWVLPLDYTATLTNASGVTNTTTSTSTYAFSGSTGTRVSEMVDYEVVLSADGSSYEIVPLYGSYLRFKTELSSTGSGEAVTTTIKALMKNDAGR